MIIDNNKSAPNLGITATKKAPRNRRALVCEDIKLVTILIKL